MSRPVNRAAADSSIGSRTEECENSESSGWWAPEIRERGIRPTDSAAAWLGHAGGILPAANHCLVAEISGRSPGFARSRAIKPSQ